ncbi:hypothetical protein BGX29_008408 [Mortierella sp. GBA35]|nr:hypothetical protein BGX29_008408 [Mortierella sp. GBA35]
MRPPFPSAAQAYAKSIDSATSSRHHPDARLTILPLPSLAALYPMDPASASSASSSSSSATAPLSSSSASGESIYRHSNSLYSQQQQQQQYHHQRQPSYQSYDRNYQKSPAPPSHPTPTPSPSPDSLNKGDNNSKAESRQSPSLTNKHEYMGTNMESLLDAVEVHSTLFASSASSTGSLSPPATNLSLSSAPSSPSASDIFSQQDDSETATATATSFASAHNRQQSLSPTHVDQQPR